MGQIDNLNNSQLPDILRRLDRLERAAPMNNSAIGRGGLLVYGDGRVTIENEEGLLVTGTAEIIGRLVATGIIDFSGDVTISGPLDVTGATTISGNTDITGDLDVDGPMTTTGTLSVEGVTTLKNDLNVTSGGKISAGNTTISPSASNGGVEFVSGGGIGGNGGSVVVKGSSNAGLITGTSAALFAGASQLTLSDGSVAIEGLPTVSGVTANLYMDPSSKQIKRIV